MPCPLAFLMLAPRVRAWIEAVMAKPKHESRSISLHPLTFDQAIKELVNSPKPSSDTKKAAPPSASSKKQTVRSPKKSAGHT